MSETKNKNPLSNNNDSDESDAKHEHDDDAEISDEALPAQAPEEDDGLGDDMPILKNARSDEFDPTEDYFEEEDEEGGD